MWPASLSALASGESSSALMTIGPHVRLRALAMNAVLVPLPAPGAPPSRMISFGKRRFSRPNVGLEILPDGFEDQLGVLDLEIAELAPDRVGGLLGHLLSFDAVITPAPIRTVFGSFLVCLVRRIDYGRHHRRAPLGVGRRGSVPR